MQNFFFNMDKLLQYRCISPLEFDALFDAAPYRDQKCGNIYTAVRNDV